MAIHHEIRTNRKQKIRKVKLTPLKAIKFNCIECMGFQDKFVFDCTDKLCPLYPFRIGKTMSRD
jgi:hypothetical protein